MDSEEEKEKIVFPAGDTPLPPLKSYLKGPAQAKITSFTKVTSKKTSNEHVEVIETEAEETTIAGKNNETNEVVVGVEPVKKKPRKSKKKTRTKKKSNSQKVTFSASNHIRVVPALEQDDIDTIASDETSKFQTKAEEEKTVPPKHLRYRLGMQLDNIDAATILNEDEDVDATELTTTQRICLVFMDLAKFICNNIDLLALFVSWKNKEGFSTMSTKIGDEFPKEVVQIASFFDGYRANLKSKNRMYFKFCLHMQCMYTCEHIYKHIHICT